VAAFCLSNETTGERGMVTLNLDDKPGLMTAVRSGRVQFAERRYPWAAIGVSVTVAVALLGWLVSGLGEYHNADKALDKRVTTLEAQRAEDVKNRDQQRGEDQKWRERVDEKLDRMIEQLATVRR
jgi:hypothetical protein